MKKEKIKKHPSAKRDECFLVVPPLFPPESAVSGRLKMLITDRCPLADTHFSAKVQRW
jgi:hypothetical protein